MAEAVGTIRVDLFANLAEWNDGLDKASGQLRRFARETEKIARGFERTGQQLTRALTLPLVAFGGFAIKAASEAQDLQGAFNISFGSAADAATKWAEETGDALGRSTQRIQQTAIAFNEFFEDFAPSQEAAAGLSKSFTVLTEDFAAFHNVSREQSQEILLRGLTGSAKGLKKFGIDISDAALKQKAFELGIAAADAELNEQQKVLARASIIMASTAKEQGEVARSAGESEEETVRAKEAFKELLVTVGNDLLPVFNSLLSFVHDVISGFNSLDDGTRRLILIVGGIAAAAGPAAIAIGALTRAAGFCATAFRVLTAASVSTSKGIKQVGLSAGGAALSFLALAPAAHEAGRAIGGVVDGAFAPKFDDVKSHAEGVKDALIKQGFAADQASLAVRQLLLTAGGDLKKVNVDAAKAFLNSSQAIEETSEAATELAPNIDELIKGFGPLGSTVEFTAEQLERVRDTVQPVSAALADYKENLNLARAAGVDAGEAQRVFALELIEAVGGIDKARTVIEKLPPAVQELVREITAANEFETMLERIADQEEEAAKRIKKIEEEAAENVKRINEGLQDFADNLIEEFDPAAAFQKQMAKIDAAFAQGKISAEVYKVAKDAAFAETPEGEALDKALKDRAALVYDISTAFTEAATNAENAGQIIKQFVIDQLKSSVIKPFFQDIFNAIIPKPGGAGFGGGGGFNLGGLVTGIGNFFGFGGSRDTGGPVYPGMAYRIGSGVSEVFTPSVPGNVSRGPGNSAGAGGVTVVQNFNGPDPGSFRRSERQMARSARRQFAIG